MENNQELIRLEQFVDTLLNKYNDLKARFHALEATLSERDTECAGLKDEISDLQGQRSEVGSRVVGLLGRIEQWEAEQDEGSAPTKEDEGRQGSLFETGDENQGDEDKG